MSYRGLCKQLMHLSFSMFFINKFVSYKGSSCISTLSHILLLTFLVTQKSAKSSLSMRNISIIMQNRRHRTKSEFNRKYKACKHVVQYMNIKFQMPNNAYSWEGIVCGWFVSKKDEKCVRRIISSTSELRLCSAPSFWPEVRWEQTKHICDWNNDILTETEPYISNHKLVTKSSNINISRFNIHHIYSVSCPLQLMKSPACHQSHCNASQYGGHCYPFIKVHKSCILTKHLFPFSGMELATFIAWCCAK